MGIFENVFKKNEIEIASPMKGRCISIKEVPDQAFSQELLGKGVAIVPEDGKVYAPADGIVSVIFPTGHAIAVTTDTGAEVLIHIGLDTVKLEGRHYTIIAKPEQRVKKGDLLIEADLDAIVAEGYDVITPVLICNTDTFKDVIKEADQQVEVGTNIMKLKV